MVGLLGTTAPAALVSVLGWAPVTQYTSAAVPEHCIILASLNLGFALL